MTPADLRDQIVNATKYYRKHYYARNSPHFASRFIAERELNLQLRYIRREVRQVIDNHYPDKSNEPQ